jgi:tRNA(fMet)-specific endonuclease VapC
VSRLLPPDPYLLDTNILLRLVRDDNLARWVEATYAFIGQGMNPLISSVSEGEIRSLALQFGWGRTRQARLEAVLGRAIAVPLEFAGVIEAYARIDAHCRRMGTPIGENDTWIAATAHATGSRLLTTDHDFDQLDPTFLVRDWIDPAQHR